MRPVGAWLVLLTLLVGAGVALGPVAAQAATDSITDLSVDYDIAADGSVAVRYEIDWHFSSEGRHGIDFAIATRESWDADRTKDVVYDVSGVSVSSPSGAPDTFTQKEVEAGSVGQLELRIGDRDQTVDGQKATYVISYELRGALRTFDGQPEFFWDVTSEDYPDIENFTARVTAPGEIRKSRCLVGTSECDTEISDGGAMFTGSGVRRGEVVSVVAGLAPGTVSDAERCWSPRCRPLPSGTRGSPSVARLPLSPVSRCWVPCSDVSGSELTGGGAASHPASPPAQLRRRGG